MQRFENPHKLIKRLILPQPKTATEILVGTEYTGVAVDLVLCSCGEVSQWWIWHLNPGRVRTVYINNHCTFSRKCETQ